MKNFAVQWTERLKPILRFMAEMEERGIGMAAASITYYTLLAAFPAVAASMAIGLFIVDESRIAAVTAALAEYIPQEIIAVLNSSLGRQASQQGSNLLVAGIGICLALLGASSAMQAMMKALNSVYRVKETRTILRIHSIGIMLTACVVIVAGSVSVLLLCSYDQLLHWQVVPWLALSISLVRWFAMVALIHFMISMQFHYGANREKTVWKYLTRGTLVGVGLWLVVTVLFFAYIQNFAVFTQSYSVFTGIIALMIWCNLCAMAVLVGALIDARRS